MSGLVGLSLACLLAAAQHQGLPPQILFTILKVEGGTVGKCSNNSNTTQDCGPMQVNDIWLPEIASLHFGGNRSAAKRAVTDNGCYNVHIGAWILRRAIDQENGDIYEGIGRYHSATPQHKRKYQKLFLNKFLATFASPKTPSVASAR